jgi:hypothetical protein
VQLDFRISPPGTIHIPPRCRAPPGFPLVSPLHKRGNGCKNIGLNTRKEIFCPEISKVDFFGKTGIKNLAFFRKYREGGLTGK